MPQQNSTDANEIRDQLPTDLNVSEFVGVYKFPDNSRRRIPGYIYLGLGVAIIVLVVVVGSDGPLINSGVLTGGVVLSLFGLLCLTSGWRMTIDEQDALSAAGEAVGFAVGHASAQQVWRGFRSRPTWRVLCYSNEDPPMRRGLVLVDAVDGKVVEHLAQENLEDWS
ncbi:MAG: hypothetical protein O3B91_07280 [Actinomycetota bacterium]|nr:hypothetical protein [Actinomycetota bacterium]MDA3019250.1 hypothetical protein [Actinomycetota bacterium]